VTGVVSSNMNATVAACQTAVADLDVPANCRTVESRLESLPDRVDLACFPEYALTGFVPDERVHEAAIDPDGDAVARVRTAASKAGCDVLVGFLERTGSRPHNALAYLVPDGRTTVYRKRHLRGGETDVLRAGEERVTVETPLGTAGLLACYDLNFVVDSAALTDRGVDALLIAGAWPATHAANWRLLVRARALDGVRWAVGAGRTGRRDVAGAPVVEYAGRSLLARPDGGIRAELGTDERDLVADLDRAVLERQRDLVGIGG
jgi:predicted amidohydrolase